MRRRRAATRARRPLGRAHAERVLAAPLDHVERAAAARAEARADQDRRAAGADRALSAPETGAADERVDLRDAGLDRDELRAPLDDEPFVEVVAAVHLEREAAEVAEPLLAQEEQRSALAPQLAGGRRRRLAMEERPRRAEDTGTASGSASRASARLQLDTTRRSSVISRTAQAGPSRVLPESLTPP